MVLFTNEAYDYFNNDFDSVQAFADLGVQMTNDAYANSNISLRMRLVRAAKIVSNTFVESDFSTDLGRLQSLSDGYMDDDISNYRAAVGADAVILVTSDAQYCGLGYLWATSTLAYSLISVYCPQSLSHEVGHNVGAHHDRGTVGSTDYTTYNYGYCWDTSATTCSRSVLAYAGCTTDNGQSGCPRAFYFSSPSITNGALTRTTGISTSDNARVHNERATTITNWVPAVRTGGIISSAMPAFAVEDSCAEVVISGWRIGSGADITSVTLAGVEATRILSQTEDSVVVWAGRGAGALQALATGTGTGNIVVTSSAGLVSTLVGGFSYAGASNALTADFESGIPLYWQSTGHFSWNVGRYCSSLPCSVAPNSGPSVGHGGTGDFARVSAPAEGEETAQLDSYFNLNSTCTDTVTSISLYYHMWTRYSQCRGSLVVQEQLSGGGWTTVATASAFQSAQNDDYLPLAHTFSNPTQVTGVRILADPTSSIASCFNYASVSIDDIVVQRSTQCTNNFCGTVSPTTIPTASPTLGPGETHAPTVEPSPTPTVASTIPKTSVPTDAPTEAPTAPTSTYTFPHTTGTLSNTNSARKNYDSVLQSACSDDELFFSTCSSHRGDTYTRLFLDGVQVARNDDSETGLCSEITYTYTAAVCGTLELRLGCFSSDSCSMTATVAVRSPFDWDSFRATGIAQLDTFKGDKYNLIGASECRVLQNAEKAIVVAKSGVVSMRRAKDEDCTPLVVASGTCPKITTMNGYARMHVNERPVKVDATKLTLVFGKSGNPKVFRWSQPLLKDTDVVKFRARGKGDGELHEQDFEFAWQLRLNEDMQGSDGKIRNFPKGGHHFLEIQIQQGGDVRSCLRMDNLNV
ncbi:hypothetical protein B484DRAFT_445580 [Ochromonadaceae sp. CCMP2298]|nr:hypothetical protein B484DRAFT_445580 [Ochromonadaceae sp. CCMP2298]